MQLWTSLRLAPTRYFAFAVILISAVFSAATPSQVAHAQIRIPAAAMLDQGHLDKLLERGKNFEQQQKWGEALSLYEKSLKDFPKRRELLQRKSLARAHYELGRRYADASYVDAIGKMNSRQAENLYAELLLKIQAHYVHEPDWNVLLEHGLFQMDVAMAEPVYLNRHLSGTTQIQRAELKSYLHSMLGNRKVNSRVQAAEAVVQAAQSAERRYGIPSQAIIMEYACAATTALDTYSSFLTANQLEEVFSQIEGAFVGLGIEIKAEDNALLIVNVINGGPAHRANLNAGDRIVSVAGKTTAEISTDAAADLLKGAEGTYVDLTIISSQGTSRQLKLQRQKVDVPCVEEVKMLDQQNGIGYFRLTSFQKTTSRDVDAALWQLHRKGMKSLIIDVRGNPGGLLNASVDVADKFVSKGTIVSTRGRSPRENFDYKAHHAGTWNVPLIVLIDGDSASASEIFAGAIHDHQRGSVVGQRSYGKGSVQGIFPFNISKAGIRLTTAKFYSPSGQPISNRGVQPNVLVRTTAKPATDAQAVEDAIDPTLNAGLQVARRQLSQR